MYANLCRWNWNVSIFDNLKNQSKTKSRKVKAEEEAGPQKGKKKKKEAEEDDTKWKWFVHCPQIIIKANRLHSHSVDYYFTIQYYKFYSNSNINECFLLSIVTIFIPWTNSSFCWWVVRVVCRYSLLKGWIEGADCSRIAIRTLVSSTIIEYFFSIYYNHFYSNSVIN